MQKKTEKTYLTYSVAKQKTDAEILLKVFREEGIDAYVEEEKHHSQVLQAYGQQIPEPRYLVKIPAADFQGAEKLELALIEELIAQTDRSYRLFKLSNEELLEIIQNPEDWSKYNFLLARKILAERGLDFDEQSLKELEEQRLKKLAQPESPSLLSLSISYALVPLGLFVLVALRWNELFVLLELFALVFGFLLSSQKKTLPNGSRVYAYDSKAQSHGFKICILALLALAYAFAVYVLPQVF